MSKSLKEFIDEHILKEYKNFKVENGVFELCTPRKKKGFNSVYEEIFKAYENYQGRPYRGYKYRDNIKAAIRKSKFYEIIPNKEKKFIFREKTSQEIVNLKKRKKITYEKMVVASPVSSGYGSGENSPIPSPPSECADDTPLSTSQANQHEYIDSGDFDMEEITDKTKPDPIQELCCEVYKKFFPSDPGLHQDECIENNNAQKFLNEADGALLSADTQDKYRENHNPQKILNEADGTLLSADTQGFSMEPQGKIATIYQITLLVTV